VARASTWHRTSNNGVCALASQYQQSLGCVIVECTARFQKVLPFHSEKSACLPTIVGMFNSPDVALAGFSD